MNLNTHIGSTFCRVKIHRQCVMRISIGNGDCKLAKKKYSITMMF